MKTTVESLTQHIEEGYNQKIIEQMSAEDAVRIVLQALVEEELPHLEERIENFQGKRFTDLGKIQLLEEIQEETTK